MADQAESWASFGHDVVLASPAPATPPNASQPSLHEGTPESVGTAMSTPRGGDSSADIAFLQAQLAVAVERASAAELQCKTMQDMLQQEISSTENSFEREALVKAQLRMAVVRIDELSHEAAVKKRLSLLLPEAGRRLLRRFRLGHEQPGPSGSAGGAAPGRGATGGTSQRRPRQQPPEQLQPEVAARPGFLSERSSAPVAALGAGASSGSTSARPPVVPALLQPRARSESRAAVAVDAAMASATSLQRTGRPYTQVSASVWG